MKRMWQTICVTFIGLSIGISSVIASPIIFTYDTTGRLQSFSLPSGSSATFTYDANGNRLHESVKPPPDITAPTVAGTSIPDGATAVPINAPITVTFSEPMDAATITTSSFQVADGTGPIAGTVSYANSTATFTATAPLNYFTDYTATVTTDVKDAAGNPLAAPVSWSFRTIVPPVIGAAGGGGHTVTIGTDGSVWTWGYNSHGQLGSGSLVDLNAPARVNGVTGSATAVAGGDSHTVAVAGGVVWSWGRNTVGQLGDGTTTDRNVPVQIGGLPPVTAVAAGVLHAVALTTPAAGGEVYAWGSNTLGQVGDGTTMQQTSPVKVPGIAGATVISSRGNHTLALSGADGTVWTWGFNGWGQLGDGTTTTSTTPKQVQGLTGVDAIAAGFGHSLAKVNGTVYAWGLNANGQLGDGTTNNQSAPQAVAALAGIDIVAIAAGANFSLALDANGAVYAWGLNSSGQLGDGTFTDQLNPKTIGTFTGAVGIAAGGSHTMVWKADGTMSSWGYNFYGQVGNGSATYVAYTPTPVLTNVQAVSNGGKHTLALLADGTVRAWGSNSNGQLGDGTTTNRDAPVAVPGLTNVTDIAAGSRFSVAVENNDTVRVWGINSSKELGLGAASADVLQPTPLPGLSGVTAVAAGDFSTAAIVGATNDVWTWGSNSNGQLGNGSYANPGVPAAVPGLTGATTITGGGRHFLTLKSDKTIVAWGRNADGELGDGTKVERTAPVTVAGLTDVIAIGAGHRHSLAVTADGTAFAWGLNSSGQLGDGTFAQHSAPAPISNLVNVAAVAGGASHSLARLLDGSVQAWGFNLLGQLGDGTAVTTGKNLPVQAVGLAGIEFVDAGTGSSSYALDLATGTLYEWGWNGATAFVDGTIPWVLVPTAVLWPE
ncbi:MAG: Ig-like domain-containing protein [Deltaproteobacteria bacterium]|nr:Ig-like domain-containing protein [Deltaproteobacteria bacterium]